MTITIIRKLNINVGMYICLITKNPYYSNECDYFTTQQQNLLMMYKRLKFSLTAKEYYRYQSGQQKI